MIAPPTSMNTDLSIRAVLASVGGAPAPILHVLRQFRPAHVWYFCSAGSRATADGIQRQLDWHPQARFIEVERFEELGPCYRELRRKIPEILEETKVEPQHVMVDYTGGTKTMSAALVLMAVDLFQKFSYVGGEQREKGGLGITLDGKERALYQGNPWSELAIREIERARDLWAGCLFDVAAEVLESTAKRVPQKRRFKVLAELAEALAARHRLDFSGAEKRLAPLRGKLPLLFDGVNDLGLLKFVEQAHEICRACASDEPNDTFLRELLDNTLRTARQHRFEDAAARLYRAMEMQGQIWLAEATNKAFMNGRCRRDKIDTLPSQLKSLDFCRPGEAGEIKLSLEQVWRCLAALEHERAKIIVSDLDNKEPSGKTKSRWRAATEKRNTSILAHGTLAIGQSGFDQMKALATEFLKLDLSGESHPIPPLDPRWFW